MKTVNGNIFTYSSPELPRELTSTYIQRNDLLAYNVF